MFICQRQNMYKRYSYETLMIEFINNPEFVTPIYWNYLDDCLPTVGRTKRFNNQIFSNINISNINITAKSNLYWLYRNQNSVFGVGGQEIVHSSLLLSLHLFISIVCD